MVGPRRVHVRCPAVLPLLLLAMAVPACVGALPVCEPGFVAPDGSWVLPVAAFDDSLAAAGWSSDNLVVRTEDQDLSVTEIITYAPRDGGAPLAVLVLLDGLRGDGAQAASPAPWVAALRNGLDRPGLISACGRCGPASPELPRPADDSAVTWPAEVYEVQAQDARLWDGVLEALAALSELEQPDRRVLVLVSDGREELVSRHVPASCLEAAVRARVAIYVLAVVAGSSGDSDQARLRDLAVRSGGQFVADRGGLTGTGAGPTATEMCARIAAVWGFRFAAVATTLPVNLTIEPSGGAGPRFQGSIAVRQLPRPPGFRRWYLLGGGLLVIAGAGAALWRQRNKTVGELLIAARDGARRMPIRRHGVTIGSDRDNGLVLANRDVSQHHAVIRVHRDEVVLTDLRSARGTTVNGLAVVTHRLAHGDRIRVGREVELVYRGATLRGRRRA